MYAQYASCLLQFTHVTQFLRADCWDQLPWQPPIIWWLLTTFPFYFFPCTYCCSAVQMWMSRGRILWYNTSLPYTTHFIIQQFYPAGGLLLLKHLVYHTFKIRHTKTPHALPVFCCSIMHAKASWITRGHKSQSQSLISYLTNCCHRRTFSYTKHSSPSFLLWPQICWPWTGRFDFYLSHTAERV